ncbi:hypothetical protein PR048_005075 [Dryococelus australis]|uniref:Uncharacterized protein n=1 Tax=Dryococelus australis TaxID=614101 RepID=A0ABQ9I8B9_9NEOP|nr:hypothetical protein PR048_005075 [Dryococelus australis]
MFLNILQIGRSHLQNLYKTFLMEGSFIEKLKSIQSHYRKSKIVSKQYLPNSLNITAMWEQ